MAWATIAHDPRGLLADPLDRALSVVRPLFDDIYVEATTETAPAVLGVLEEHTAEYVQSPPDGSAIGLHRRAAVAAAVQGGADHILYSDPDHLIIWASSDENELVRILERSAEADCTVVGKSPEALAVVPPHLRDTEAIVNHVFELVTGHKWELMSAVRGLSRRAAELIVRESTVGSIGNDVEWPLLCLRARLDVRYFESTALRYETLEGLSDPGHGLARAMDPRAWMNRMRIAMDQLDALARFID